jgi:hypothetical protein
MVGQFIQIRKKMLRTNLNKIFIQNYFYLGCSLLFFGYLIWLYYFSLPFNQDIISHWNAKLYSNTFLSQQQGNSSNFLTSQNYFYSILNELKVSVFQLRFIQFTLVSILCLVLSRITSSASLSMLGSSAFFILVFGSMRFFQYGTFFPDLVLYEILISIGILLLFLCDFISQSHRNQKIILFLLGSILGVMFFIYSNSLLILGLFLVFIYKRKIALRRENILNSIVFCLPIFGLILLRTCLEKTAVSLSFFSSIFYFEPTHFISVFFLIIEFFVRNISLIGVLIPVLLFLLCVNILKNKTKIKLQENELFPQLIIFLIFLCFILVFERSHSKELLVAPLPFVYAVLTLGIVCNMNVSVKKEFSFFIISVLSIWTLYSLNSGNLMKTDFEKKLNISDLYKLTSHFEKQLPADIKLCAPINLFDSIKNQNLCEKFIGYKFGKMTLHLEVIHSALFTPPEKILPMFILTPKIFGLIKKNNIDVYNEFNKILDRFFLSFKYKSITFYLPKDNSQLYEKLAKI